MRKKIFTRQVTVEVFEEEDGSVSIEGALLDTMPPDAGYFQLGRRPADRRPPGVLHGLNVRWLVNRETGEVLRSDGEFPNPPWAGCPAFLPRLASLEGLKLGRGFSKAMMERVGLHLGCSHATSVFNEMLRAPWQSYFIKKLNGAADAQDADVSCHMRRPDGPVDQARAKGVDVFVEDW